MFWGSPTEQGPTSVKEFSEGRTFTPKNDTQFRRPVTEKRLPLTPLNRPVLQIPFTERRPHIIPRNRSIPTKYYPVATPSVNKNFSRFKNTMISELFKLFNESIFEGKVRFYI